MATSAICSIDGCGKKHEARGYCRLHYRRFQTHGDPLARAKPANGEVLRYLLDVVLPYDGDECLVWPFSKLGKGYGQFWADGRRYVASRYVCEAVYGSPPTPQHQARHLCGSGQPACVNPRHLAWGTPVDNASDKLAHGTYYRSKFTSEQIRNIIARCSAGDRQRDVAADYGVSQATVSRICIGGGRERFRSWGGL